MGGTSASSTSAAPVCPVTDAGQLSDAMVKALDAYVASQQLVQATATPLYAKDAAVQAIGTTVNSANSELQTNNKMLVKQYSADKEKLSAMAASIQKDYKSENSTLNNLDSKLTAQIAMGGTIQKSCTSHDIACPSSQPSCVKSDLSLRNAQFHHIDPLAPSLDVGAWLRLVSEEGKCDVSYEVSSDCTDCTVGAAGKAPCHLQCTCSGVPLEIDLGQCALPNDVGKPHAAMEVQYNPKISLACASPGSKLLPDSGTTSTPVPSTTSTPVPSTTSTPVPSTTSTPVPSTTSTPGPSTMPTPGPDVDVENL